MKPKSINFSDIQAMRKKLDGKPEGIPFGFQTL